MPDTPPVAALDLIAADSLLSEDERAIRDTVRTYLDREVRPHVAEWFEAGELPARELAAGLGGLGVLGMHLHGYGCAGTSAVAYGLACLELEAVDSGIRSLVSVQGSLAMYAIHAYGSEDQRQEWLPRMAAGDGDRLLRADRAGLRLEPGRDAHDRQAGRGRLGAGRHQDVDHQRRGGRRRRRVGTHRRRDPRLRGPHRHPRVHRQPGQAQAVPARVGDQRARAGVRPAAGIGACSPGAQGLARPAGLPERGPVRDRLRRARSGPGLPGDGDRRTR